ncbi:MAG TPA: hypothetical protein VNZ52_15685 [Candidatus Thermoplasmatota archaeon]|nr:hypothetical protein [Candidatus Thermoplasmatota archaeon]
MNEGRKREVDPTRKFEWRDAILAVLLDNFIERRTPVTVGAMHEELRRQRLPGIRHYDVEAELGALVDEGKVSSREVTNGIFYELNPEVFFAVPPDRIAANKERAQSTDPRTAERGSLFLRNLPIMETDPLSRRSQEPPSLDIFGGHQPRVTALLRNPEKVQKLQLRIGEYRSTRPRKGQGLSN